PTLVSLMHLRYLPSLSFAKSPSSSAIYTLSLHDALPILMLQRDIEQLSNPNFIPDSSNAVYITFLIIGIIGYFTIPTVANWIVQDRKSTRLNSSHVSISYAVFCLKKKKKNITKRREEDNRKDLEGNRFTQNMQKNIQREWQ